MPDHLMPEVLSAGSKRDIQELLHQRGVQVSHETLRQWNIKFAPLSTEELRHRAPRRGSRWFIDEVCVEIKGKKHWLFLARTAPMTTLGRWRAVDNSGAVLDVLLEARRDTQAAITVLKRLLVNDAVPDVIHTDKLWSYRAAIRTLLVLRSVEHVQVTSTARCTPLIEHSHRLTSQQEWSGQASSWALSCPRSRIGFINSRRTQEFLSVHARVSNLQQHSRTTVPAYLRRINQNRAYLAWQTAVGVAV